VAAGSCYSCLASCYIDSSYFVLAILGGGLVSSAWLLVFHYGRLNTAGVAVLNESWRGWRGIQAWL